MAPSPEEFIPQIEWKPDCQGKANYDGPLISIEARSWPASYQLNEMFSAEAYIFINHNPEPFSLAHAKFEAPTKEEVEAMVIKWVRENSRNLIKKLLT